MPKPKPIQLKRNQVAPLGVMLKGAIDEARRAVSGYIKEVKDNRELLKSKQGRPNKPWATCSELAIPMGKYLRNHFLAREVRALMGVVPIYNVHPHNVRWKDSAPQVEAFLQRLVEQRRFGFEPVVSRLLQAAFDDGSGVAYITWDSTKRRQTRWVRGAAGWSRDEQDVTLYEGPRIDYVPIERVGCYPAQMADFQRSTGVYLLLPQSGDELLMRAQRGEYDMEQVESLRVQGTDEAALENASDSNRELSNMQETPVAFHAKVFEIAECYWRLGRDIAESTIEPVDEGRDKQPAQDWLITMHLPTNTILRAIPNPWGHGMRPLVSFRAFPDKFGLFGDSVMDLAGDVQIATTALLRLVIDHMALQIDPEIMVPAAMGPEKIREMKRQRGPGGMLAVPDGYWGKVEPFSREQSHPTSAIPLMQFLHGFTERGLLSDPQMGRQMERRATATEFLGTMQEGGELISMVTDRLSTATGELGEFLLLLTYEYANTEAVQNLWALATDAQPGGGMVGVEALGGDYDLQPGGTMENSNRAMRAQKADEIYGILTQNPFCQSYPARLWAVTHHMLSERGIQKPERYIGTEQDVKQVEDQAVQVAQNEEQAGQAEQQEAVGQQAEQTQELIEKIAEGVLTKLAESAPEESEAPKKEKAA